MSEMGLFLDAEAQARRHSSRAASSPDEEGLPWTTPRHVRGSWGLGPNRGLTSGGGGQAPASSPSGTGAKVSEFDFPWAARAQARRHSSRASSSPEEDGLSGATLGCG